VDVASGWKKMAASQGHRPLGMHAAHPYCVHEKMDPISRWDRSGASTLHPQIFWPDKLDGNNQLIINVWIIYVSGSMLYS